MYRNHGAEIETVLPESPASSAGLLSGDVVVAINGHAVTDVIDYLFYGGEEELSFAVKRRDKKLSFKLFVKEGFSTGIRIKPFKVKTCNNRCIFCFVGQLPRGLRKSLYIKDEDYRMSFLYGNYVTLTNISPWDRKRIVQQRLSPLYLSVHSTDKAVRNAMIGNVKAPDILNEITFLKENKIRMHCQIVLCPGLNDGKALQKTIRDLYRFYPYVSSIAVVPVGLTCHRKTSPKLKPVGKEEAAGTLEIIEVFQRRFRKKHGDSIVYASDELFIMAGAEFAPLSEYGDLPQVENGVGMTPLFIQQARREKIPHVKIKKRFIVFTGVSFYPYLSKFVDRIRKAGIDMEALIVENTYFGRSITVTGLLTGRDVMKSLAEKVRKGDILLIPDVVMREGDDVFLDDISVGDIEELLGIRAITINSTPKGLIDAVVAMSRD
jgi:putative radical SAM enzyme (TIGR03279 family)